MKFWNLTSPCSAANSRASALLVWASKLSHKHIRECADAQVCSHYACAHMCTTTRFQFTVMQNQWCYCTHMECAWYPSNSFLNFSNTPSNSKHKTFHRCIVAYTECGNCISKQELLLSSVCLMSLSHVCLIKIHPSLVSECVLACMLNFKSPMLYRDHGFWKRHICTCLSTYRASQYPKQASKFIDNSWFKGLEGKKTPTFSDSMLCCDYE